MLAYLHGFLYDINHIQFMHLYYYLFSSKNVFGDLIIIIDLDWKS